MLEQALGLEVELPWVVKGVSLVAVKMSY